MRLLDERMTPGFLVVLLDEAWIELLIQLSGRVVRDVQQLHVRVALVVLGADDQDRKRSQPYREQIERARSVQLQGELAGEE